MGYGRWGRCVICCWKVVALAGLGERERTALAMLAADVPGVCWAKLLFSAKEAVFKAWSPATGRWLGFADAELELDADGTFAARLVDAPGYRGRWIAARGLIATAVVVPLSRP